MATMWRKAMLYLGLGPDEEYDDYEAVDEPPAAARPRPATVGASRYPAAGRDVEARPEPDYPSGAVRTLNPQPVRPSAPSTPDPAARPQTAVVRPIQAVPSAKPHVVEPTSFNEAQEVADKFKGTVPVIVNLQNVDRDLSRRIIDFASGLCYGLGGQMERVANQVYLLTPLNVEVSVEERRRLEERGFER
ncbi:MAG: cell division protein SepF [Acidimicrobiia bacterium]